MVGPALPRLRTRRAMQAAPILLSALRVPRTRIASPLLRTTSRMNLFDGLILSRSVHQRNLSRGAG